MDSPQKEEIKKFSHKQKKLLAKRISELEKKNDVLKVCEIIKSDPTLANSCEGITENSNGVFMYFQNLSDATYLGIEEYINNIIVPVSSDENKNYIPYAHDEYSLQPNMGLKLKYSNKEKNLLKRRRYDQSLEEESSSE